MKNVFRNYPVSFIKNSNPRFDTLTPNVVTGFDDLKFLNFRESQYSTKEYRNYLAGLK